MAKKHDLADRRKALEESFFTKENERLLSNLREKRENEKEREALEGVLSIQDPAILDELIGVGIRAETWLALSLIPLVEVAWANGNVDDAEREAIVKAAGEVGIGPFSPANDLLEKWLSRKPLPSVRAAWIDYVGAAKSVLGGAASDALREETLEQARAVAAAAGGFIGIIPPISTKEEEVLKELAAAF